MCAKCGRSARATLTGALVALCSLAVAVPGWSKSPNIVLITIDTVRADHVGCYGDRQAHTPNLDALDRDGVHFRTTVASVPLTLPSHCSIMTGTYPPLHGVRDNLGYKLGTSTPTLAEILKRSGYATAAFVGAAVLDADRGLNQGFDTYSSPFERKMGRDNPINFNLQDLQRPAEAVIADALGWMSTQSAHASKPFFVWIHLYDPHTPYDPPARFRALLKNPYDGEIAYADDAIGKFFAYLKEHGLYDPALIITTSDHGESFGEHGEYNHGFFIYDTTLLVPLIIKPPSGSGISPHAIDAPVRSIDIAPTVLQFLDIPTPSIMQGSGLLPLMLGKTAPATGVAYGESYYPNEFGWSELRSIRSGHVKYIDAPKPELYDLASDPGEIHNLYQARRTSALKLKSQLSSLIARITSKKPIERTPVAPTELEKLSSLGYVGTASPSSSLGQGKRLPDPKDELGTFKMLFSATQLATQGKCDRAVPLLTRLTKEQPALFMGQMTLAKCELAAGKVEAADSTLTTALRLRPDDQQALFYKGIGQFQMGHFKDSLATLLSVEKVLQDEPYVHFYIGSIYEQEHKADQALAEFQKCAEIDPNFEVAVFKTGFYLAKSGRFQEAAVQMKKVVAMDPENASAHFNLALAYAKSGDDAAAQPEFKTACRLKSTFCLPPDQQH
jgi:arylsulfatase A-like enzyme/thioredoxin-like negative regulator of GroEL